jgi:thiosulfate dehydrogenase [quinone] large subunit
MFDSAKDHDTPITARSRFTESWPRQATDVAQTTFASTAYATLINRTRSRGMRTTSSVKDSGGVRVTPALRYLLAGVRLALGWLFLWAFLDKTFGLGHDTPAASSWLNGGSPTKGFLTSTAKGPFVGVYHAIGGTSLADAIFMGGLLAIGGALIAGIGLRLVAAAGALLAVMMWAVVLPPVGNPFLDDHLIYAAVLVVLALARAGDTLGLGRTWAATPMVRRATWLI